MKAKKNKIEYLEIIIVLDGLSIVMTFHNNWAKTLVMVQLKQISRLSSQVEKME